MRMHSNPEFPPFSTYPREWRSHWKWRLPVTPALGKLRQEGGKPCWQASGQYRLQNKTYPQNKTRKTNKQTNWRRNKDILHCPDYGGKDFQHNFLLAAWVSSINRSQTQRLENKGHISRLQSRIDLHRYGSEWGEGWVLEMSSAWARKWERNSSAKLPCVSGHMRKLMNAFKLLTMNRKHAGK